MQLAESTESASATTSVSLQQSSVVTSDAPRRGESGHTLAYSQKRPDSERIADATVKLADETGHHEVVQFRLEPDRRLQAYRTRWTARRKSKSKCDKQMPFPQWIDGTIDLFDASNHNENESPVIEPSTVVRGSSKSIQVWQHSQKKLRQEPFPMQSPLDCLNESDRVLYEALLSAATRISCTGMQSSELVQMGYSQLSAATNKCKRNIQRAVGRLISKHFISVVSAANSHVGESTVYRVFSPGEIGEALCAAGLTHWVQVGMGRKPTGMGP